MKAAENAMKTLAAEFDSTFLATVMELEARREPVIVTKDGKAVARLVPEPVERTGSIFGFYRGKLEIKGDILSPAFDSEDWDG
jgi:hypothetical protein